jgi:hypothetical protein
MSTPERELLEGIRDADAHRGGIRCLRLFRLDRALGLALRAEVLALRAREPWSDVQEREHVTHWAGPRGAVRQWSLVNRSGDCADFRDDHDLSCVCKTFHLAARYPQLAAFADALPHLVNLRINELGPGAGLAPHEEHSLFPDFRGGAAVRARFHLPLCTSRDARMLLDGDLVRFAPRTIYYFNQGCVHGADNPPARARIHLVWDQLLTAEVFATMFGEEDTPPGWRRVHACERAVRPLAQVRVTHHARIPPLVLPDEAERVRLSVVR